MDRISYWLRDALTGKPNVSAFFSYPFLLVLLLLVYLDVTSEVRFPGHTSNHLPGFFITAMLILNHLAFSFSWGSAIVRAVLRAGAVAWIVFVWVFLADRWSV